ncbi:zinc finger protein Xfin [Ixodes scapularis]|uniref:zinc finger protein Xfin n=1 Tax=Ixodes scapularis TaxID=6945 RepID=UPI001A9CFF4B|nr:zinc finger protein Xfin [Ixodes scapularis]
MSSLDIVQSLQTKQLMLDLLTTSKLPKTLAAFSRQLEPVKIIHFFKCMESLCDYSTDDSDLFWAHLAVHPERTFSCSYCSKLIVSESSLVKHMVTVHGSCDFQCPLCFYRSCSKMHVIVHTLVVHRSRLVRWYLCKAVAPSAVEPISQVDLTTKFYRCVEGCSFHCLSPEVFVKHLSEKHSCYQQYTCHLCLGMVKSPNSLVQHYAAVHSFHFVQCLHCNFGRETAWDVLVHVAEEHADKPFKVLLRSSEAVEVFKRVQGLSKAPSHAAIPSPPVSCPAQPIATLNETVESASEYQQELPSPVLCGLGECTQTFPTAEVLLSHLTKDHPTELELSCPLCCQLRNVPWEDLCLHIVDAHTELARCPYKKCIFVSKTQQAIDDHIMHVHQSFESEEIEVHGKSEEAIPPQAKELPCPEDGTDNSNETCGSAQEIDETETKKLYTCRMCYQKAMQSQDYFRHMSFGHGVKFFCGHCEKGYKSGKLLLHHHEKHHPGRLASVKSYEHNNFSEVSPSILSGFQEEPQQLVHKKTKTMKRTDHSVECNRDSASSHSTAKDNNRSSKKLANHPADAGNVSMHIFCGHCYKSYKVLKHVISHINTIHPGLPLAIKRMDMAKLEDVANVDELLERSADSGCYLEVPGKNDSVEKRDSPAENKTDTSPVLRRRKYCRRIVVSSDSEDDVPEPWKLTISYYGREIEPVDYKNLFVRLPKGDGRIPYCQLAGVLKLQPIVLEKKLRNKW